MIRIKIPLLNFRFCLPRVNSSLRGAGLGNELIPYAKAFIASRALNFRLLHPAWGLNPRKYYKYFRTSRLDWVGYKMLGLCLPSIAFTREDYERTGKRDYEEAVLSFAEEKGLCQEKTLVLYTEGMWAGTYEIRKAAGFMWQELYRAKGATKNLLEIDKKIDKGNIRIAVHIRRGDFSRCFGGNPEEIRGVFNKAIEIDWFTRVCLNLKKAFHGKVSFILLTDGTKEEVKEFVKAVDPISTENQTYRDCSDLLLAATADILICSISSFSIRAATLSKKAYIWYKPHLQNCGGFLTIWGDALTDGSSRIPEATLKYDLLRQKNRSDSVRVRGIAVGNDGVMSQEFLAQLLDLRKNYIDEFDLVMHGAVPEQLFN